MKRCPITYKPLDDCDTHVNYSAAGLRKLSPRLKSLADLPFSAEEQVKEAAQRATKMSVQGVQPKLSARLEVKKGCFEIVDTGGQYIFKPQNPFFSNLPENEDLTMKMAASIGIEVPFHGLVYSRDSSMTYFIKRFDRIGRKRKLAVEDFAQLAGCHRETKYDSSMEKIAEIIQRYCTFPAIEKVKLYRLTLFNFLVGNEDMHLKNFSLITRSNKIELSPAYDLLNTTIVLNRPVEEIALPISGKKRKLTREILIDYYGKERLGLTDRVMETVFRDLADGWKAWWELIDNSFLPDPFKRKYIDLLHHRCSRLGISTGS